MFWVLSMNMQFASPLIQTLTPRSDQLELKDALLAILDNGNHAYLESPTGTGKTLTIALTGEARPDYSKIFLAHSIDIVQQARSDFELFHQMGLVDDLSVWRFATWHLFRNAITNNSVSDWACNGRPIIAFVDECHIGGSDTGGDTNVSFPMIRSAAEKTVWVSATPWDLDENALGLREGHTARMSLEAAYKTDLLNPVDLVRVDCGLQLRIAVKELELSEGKSLHRLAGRVFEIDTNTADEVFENLNDELEVAIQRKLRPTDVRLIMQHRIRLMADLYLKLHNGDQAIFWVPNQQVAKDCADYITAGLKNGQRAEPIITEPDKSSADAEYATAAKQSFDANGEVRVLCVVYRLREGFNCKALHLGFDCSWNPRNVRSTIQKLGRLIRKADGKPASKYYYAVDVKTVAGASNRDLNEVFVSDLAGQLALDEVSARFVAEGLVENISVSAAVSNTHTLAKQNVESAAYEVGDREVRTVTTALFNFTEAEGYREAVPTTLGDILLPTETIEGALERIIRAIELTGISPRWHTRDRGVLNRYIQPKGDRYSLNVVDRLKAAGWSQRQQRDLGPADSIEEIILKLEAGEEPPAHHTPNRNRLNRYINQSSPHYDPTIVNRLSQAGVTLATPQKVLTTAEIDAVKRSIMEHGTLDGITTTQRKRVRLWLMPASSSYKCDFAQWVRENYPVLVPNTRDDVAKTTNDHIERIVGAIEAGEAPPACGTTDRNRLSRWISEKSPHFRQHVFDRVLISAPDLVPAKREDTEARISEDANNIIASLKRGEAPPPYSSFDGRRMRTWLNPKTRHYREDFYKQVAEFRPELLPRDRTLTEKETQQHIDRILQVLRDGAVKQDFDEEDQKRVKRWLGVKPGNGRRFREILETEMPDKLKMLKPSSVETGSSAS